VTLSEDEVNLISELLKVVFNLMIHDDKLKGGNFEEECRHEQVSDENSLYEEVFEK
jgi:hypothetical protein